MANKQFWFNTTTDFYLKSKPPDCILYSEDGAEFKIHKARFTLRYTPDFIIFAQVLPSKLKYERSFELL